MMQKIFICILVLFFPIAYMASKDIDTTNSESPISALPTSDPHNELYSQMNLNGVVNYTVFKQAMIGYDKLEAKNKDIITLIDFSKPSTEKRLYVLDVKQKKLLFSSVVSHGKNSGGNYATTFSNKVGSNMSSLGFYVTENTYTGKNGHSLIINGLEEGINHRAKERAVVIHGAAYSNPSIIASAGRLGRSQGCPALPQHLSKPIIDTIKNGTLLYIYADNQEYFAQSSVLSKEDHSL